VSAANDAGGVVRHDRILIGLAILWAGALVVSVAMVVRVIREDRAERREFERCEVRALNGYDPRVHGRADHLRI
jgi:hypothetical protein